VKTKYQRKRALLRKTELPEIYLEYTLWKLTHTKAPVTFLAPNVGLCLNKIALII
jgi:hypothetical protein